MSYYDKIFQSSLTFPPDPTLLFHFCVQFPPFNSLFYYDLSLRIWSKIWFFTSFTVEHLWPYIILFYVTLLVYITKFSFFFVHQRTHFRYHDVSVTERNELSAIPKKPPLLSRDRLIKKTRTHIPLTCIDFGKKEKCQKKWFFNFSIPPV